MKSRSENQVYMIKQRVSARKTKQKNLRKVAWFQILEQSGIFLSSSTEK